MYSTSEQIIWMKGYITHIFIYIIARRNLAELTQYLDNQSTHLAACTGANDDSIPFMSAETFPRMLGGIRSALAETQQSQL